jgi:hypothetical protein
MKLFQRRGTLEKKLGALAAASLVAGLAMGQAVDPKLPESVRELAASRVTLDLCLTSPDFRKLADSTQRQIIAISKRIDRLSNDLHEAPKGKLLFVSYGIHVSQLGRSTDFRRQLRERPGGVCDFKAMEILDERVKRSKRLLVNGDYLEQLPSQP